MTRLALLIVTALLCASGTAAAAPERFPLPTGEVPTTETQVASAGHLSERIYFAAVGATAGNAAGRLYQGYETADSKGVTWRRLEQRHPVSHLALCGTAEAFELFGLTTTGDVLVRDLLQDKWLPRLDAPKATNIGCDERGVWLEGWGGGETLRLDAEDRWQRSDTQATLDPAPVTPKRLGSSLMTAAGACARPAQWIDEDLLVSGRIGAAGVHDLVLESSRSLGAEDDGKFRACLVSALNRAASTRGHYGAFVTHLPRVLAVPRSVELRVGGSLHTVKEVTLAGHLAGDAKLTVETSVPAVIATVSGHGRHRRLIVSRQDGGGAFEGELVLHTNLAAAPRVTIPLRAVLPTEPPSHLSPPLATFRAGRSQGTEARGRAVARLVAPGRADR